LTAETIHRAIVYFSLPAADIARFALLDFVAATRHMPMSRLDACF
jgi:hypothetical protein